jgi:hypothetical protein
VESESPSTGARKLGLSSGKRPQSSGSHGTYLVHRGAQTKQIETKSDKSAFHREANDY